MFSELCSEKGTCLCCVSPITWDVIEAVSLLEGWDGVLNVNQVGSQGRLGIVGNLSIVGVEPSSY